MEDSKNVAEKSYGKVSIHLKEMLYSRGISRNYLARAAGTRFEVIDRWYNNDVEKMDLDVLARICYVLDCLPSDLIQYDKN